MPKTLINPSSLAKPSGFNHGIVVDSGRLLFLAGQAGTDSNGKILAPGDLVAQYGQTLRNLQAVTEEAGGRLQDIVKLNIFVRDRRDYREKLKPLGKVHRSFFGDYYPTMALFGITGLMDDEALVELEGVAVLDAE